jgi:flagellar hook-associated protein 3 FlgL
MRTTFNAMYREASAGIESSQQRLAEFQRQVSTGKRIEKPSDDPSGAATAVGEHAEIANVEQYTRAATSVGSRLTVVDTVLSDIVSKLSAASSAMVAARGTTQTAAQREAYAQELQGIRDALLEDFNTSYQGSYVFGGANSSNAPFRKDPVTGAVLPYEGSTTEVMVDIDSTQSVKVAMNGDTIVRGSAGSDLFAVLDAAIAAARSGDNAALGTGLDAINAAFQRATTAQSRVGADLNTIDDQRLRLSQMKLAAMARIDKVEAVNMAEAITGMTQAQAAYQAALGAVSSVTRVSLMDYIR